MEDVIIIGAGPCGLSAAVELQRRGIRPLLIEKGNIVHSIYGYPTFMQFFSTPELLEIGDVPFVITHEKPNRQEALAYYRTVAMRNKLRIHAYETVTSIERNNDRFALRTENRFGVRAAYECRNVVMATGYFGNPNRLGIPGEDLPHVFHSFSEAHPFAGMRVVIIGGNNSAVDAALELERVGAKVTVVYRGDEYSPSIKPWVLPVFKSMADKGRIEMQFLSRVAEIRKGTVVIERRTEEGVRLEEKANDFVVALIGYAPDHRMLRELGVRIDKESGTPAFHPDTMMTHVDGLYIAGVIAAGYDANAIFIENGRLHGKVLAESIRNRMHDA